VRRPTLGDASSTLSVAARHIPDQHRGLAAQADELHSQHAAFDVGLDREPIGKVAPLVMLGEQHFKLTPFAKTLPQGPVSRSFGIALVDTHRNIADLEDELERSVDRSQPGMVAAVDRPQHAVSAELEGPAPMGPAIVAGLLIVTLERGITAVDQHRGDCLEPILGQIRMIVPRINLGHRRSQFLRLCTL
jgi:hypothetical protein